MTAEKLHEPESRTTAVPPNLRESSDYTREPDASRCFNCEYLEDEKLSFYCSKFMAKINVYQVCDDWRKKSEQSKEGYEPDRVPSLLEQAQEETINLS